MNEKKSDYAILNVTVIDGKNNPPAERQAIRISGGRIRSVRPMDRFRLSRECVPWDLSGAFVMPGLIDAHVHLSGVAGDRVGAFAIPPLVRAYKSVAQAQALLSFGVTCIRDISPHGLYLKRVFQSGELAGPRIVACGPGLARRGGHADIPEMAFELIDDPRQWGSRHYWGVFADGETELRRLVRLHLREGADQIKFWASGGGYSSVDRVEDTHYTLAECKAIVDEARLIRGVGTLAHAENEEALRFCIEAGVNSVEHGDGLNETLAETMAKKGIYLVPTLNLMANWMRDRASPNSAEAAAPCVEYGPFRTADRLRENPPVDKAGCERERARLYDLFRMAREKGVKIALGSDTVRDGVTPYGEYTIRELLTMADAGMEPLEAIRASTQTAAEVLGLAEHIGTIEPGKIADLLVLKKNPAEALDALLDRDNLLHVIQGGERRIEQRKPLDFGGREHATV